MTLKEAYGYGISYLESRGVPEASLDAWYLLEHLTGRRKSDYYAHGNVPLSEAEESNYRKLLAKRGEHIPLQHLTGNQEFMGLTFRVCEDVLIPRQDTETLVEEVLKVLKPGMRLLDVCTGSGCILLSLLHHCPGTEGWGVDISPAALVVAKGNGESLGIHARFLESDMFRGVSGEVFDVIVSNPPYIASKEIEELMPEVREHEPRLALDGGGDGLVFYRILAEEAGTYLKEDGALYLEIGYDQGVAVKELLQENGFYAVQVIKDLCGNDRVVCGRKGRG